MSQDEKLKYDPYFSTKKVEPNPNLSEGKKKYMPVKKGYVIKNHLSSNQPVYKINLHTESPPIIENHNLNAAPVIDVNWEVVNSKKSLTRMARFQRLFLKLKSKIKRHIQEMFKFKKRK